MNLCTVYIYIYICMYLCMCACMDVCMYVCMYVYITRKFLTAFFFLFHFSLPLLMLITSTPFLAQQNLQNWLNHQNLYKIKFILSSITFHKATLVKRYPTMFLQLSVIFQKCVISRKVQTIFFVCKLKEDSFFQLLIS